MENAAVVVLAGPIGHRQRNVGGSPVTEQWEARLALHQQRRRHRHLRLPG